MHPKGLLLAWAITAAASQGAADQTTEQQALLKHAPSSSWTHEQKASRARTMLKISSNGQASGIPEIAKLAIEISATSNTSQADAIEHLKSSTSQAELLLSDRQAGNVLEMFKGSSTRVSNDKDSAYVLGGGKLKPTSEDAVEVINYKAETFFSAYSTAGADIEDIRSMMRELREIPEVKTQSIEWEFSTSSRDKIRVEAKRIALQKCLAQGKETAEILGFTSDVMLVEVEESYGYFQEKRSINRIQYWPRGDEIDARPSEMEMDARISCTFGAL